MTDKASDNTQKAYTIYASTGCSCCNYENHYRGPYSSEEVAKQRADSFRSIRLLASQYSLRGNYRIAEHDAEVLPDGRVIIDSRIFPGFADQTETGDDYIGQEM